MSILIDIRKTYKNFTLNVAFSAGDGQTGRTGLLGASGCGKSLTLRCIAGIETPDSGYIEINGKTIFDSESKINLAPQLRNTGYLFQSYALFPTMTVSENIGIACGRGTEAERKSKAYRKTKVRELLDRYQIGELADRYPSQLSGGQQQRVALARMLASDPEVILLDEPFSALDSFLRRQVEEELSRTLSQFPGSIIFVSHDRDEVFRFCEKMIILDGGSIAREGKRDEVFADPQTVSAARLTGCKNIAKAIKAGESRIAVPSWGLILETDRAVPDGIMHAGIRAHHIRIADDADTENCFNFAVESRSEAPFSVTEYVTALTATGVAGGERNVRESLCRESSGRTKNCAGGNTGSTERLCLPPECILMLKKNPDPGASPDRD